MSTVLGDTEMVALKYRLRHIGRHIDDIEDAPTHSYSSAARSALILPVLGRDAYAVAIGLPDVSAFPLASPALRDWPMSSNVAAVRSTLTEVEDGRMFSPAPLLEVPRTTGTRRARVVVPSATGPKARRASLSALSFDVPQSVILCVRRKARRQVLFAKGKGGGRHKRPRRNPNSKIWC